ncbi:lipocalin-like domain-containing protein [Mesorhizobium sp. ORM8.1]
MMTIITSADREMPQTKSDEAELFGSMMGYSGTSRLEGDNKFVVHADIAWRPGWVGSEQTRIFSVDGDILLNSRRLVFAKQLAFGQRTEITAGQNVTALC